MRVLLSVEEKKKVAQQVAKMRSNNMLWADICKILGRPRQTLLDWHSKYVEQESPETAQDKGGKVKVSISEKALQDSQKRCQATPDQSTHPGRAWVRIHQPVCGPDAAYSISDRAIHWLECTVVDEEEWHKLTAHEKEAREKVWRDVTDRLIPNIYGRKQYLVQFQMRASQYNPNLISWGYMPVDELDIQFEKPETAS